MGTVDCHLSRIGKPLLPPPQLPRLTKLQVQVCRQVALKVPPEIVF